ncbi:MAG: type II secretion system F family protein [Planctomycetota bacterium]
MLQLAAREGLPYGYLVGELANDQQWSYGRRLSRLSRRLKQGTSLADAVEQTPGVLPTQQVLAIRFGVESGTLARVLDELVERQDADSVDAEQRFHKLGSYLLGVAVLGSIITAIVLFIIMPPMRLLMQEFYLELPPVSQGLMDLGNWLEDYAWLLALAIAAMSAFFLSESGWRYFHRVILPRLSGSAVRLRGAEIMHLLAISLQAGRPLTGAISTLARYYYDSGVRTQLLFVRNEIEQGADPWRSMQHTGLISEAEAQPLLVGADHASQSWTLRRLAGLRRQRVATRLRLCADVLHPIAVLSLGALVLATCLAALGPLIHLISSLS